MHQYKSGFIFEPVYKALYNTDEKDKLSGLLDLLSTFSLHFDNDNTQFIDCHPLFNIYENIIKRGLPTKLSQHCIKQMSSMFKGSEFYQNIGNDDTNTLLFSCLHLIDPRVNKTEQSKAYHENWGNYENEYLDNFFYSVAPEYLGEIFLQLLGKEIPAEELVSGNELKALKKSFEDISDFPVYDFHCEIPYDCDYKGFMVKFQQSESATIEEKQLLIQISEHLQNKGWHKPFQFKAKDVSQLSQQIKPLQSLSSSGYFSVLQSNFDKPLYSTQQGLDALQLVLSPFQIARIQFSIIQAIKSGVLSFNDKEWKIGVIERDIPASHLAVEDLCIQMKQLFQLSGETLELPKIKLYSFSTPEFAECTFVNYKPAEEHIQVCLNQPLENFSEHITYDLLIDSSILQRQWIKNEPITSSATSTAILRSAYSSIGQNKLQCNNDFRYFENQEIQNNGNNTYIIRKSIIDKLCKSYFSEEYVKETWSSLVNNSIAQKNSIVNCVANEPYYQSALLSGLLQPGACLVICRDQVSGIKYVEEFRRNLISATFFNDKTFFEEDGDGIENNPLQDINSQYIGCTFQVLRTKKFNEFISHCAEQGLIFRTVILYDAQCISEWSHDYEPLLSGFSVQINKILAKHQQTLPVYCAFSNAASYNVMNDICFEFKHTETIIYSDNPDICSHKYKIQAITVAETSSKMNERSILNAIASKKQVESGYLIKEIQKRDGNTNPASYFCCPKTSGLWGITDSNNDGLKDKLKYQYPDLKFGETINISPDNTFPKEANEDNMDHQKINAGEIDVLFGKNDFEFSFSKNLNNYIWFSSPFSIGELFRKAYRAPLSKQVHFYMLHCPKTYDFSVEKESGESITEEKLNTSSDKLFAIKNLNKTFGAVQKELHILKEFLNEITFPDFSRLDKLNNELQKLFKVHIQVEYDEEDNNDLYVFETGGEKLGTIHLKGNTFRQNEIYPDLEKGKAILNYLLKNYISICPEGTDFIQWLNENTAPEPIPGPGVQFGELAENEEFDIEFHFMNNALSKLRETLNTKVSHDFSDELLIQKFNESTYAFEFVEALDEISSVQLVTQQINIPEIIKHHFHQFRSVKDTHRLLNRFIQLGLLASYQYAPSSGLVKASFIYPGKKAIIGHLRERLSLFYSPEFANKTIAEVDASPEKDIVSNALQLLVTCIYNDCLEKHMGSIDEVEHIQNIMLQDNSEEMNRQLNVMASRYNWAKYANHLYEGAIFQEGETDAQDFEFVLKQIIIVGNKIDNWHHLKASTDLALVGSPDNYAYQLLNAWAIFLLLHYDKQKFMDGFQKLTSGLTQMAETEQLSYNNYIVNINNFMATIYEHNSALKPKIEPLLHLKTHTSWLMNFNQQFLHKKEYTETI